MHFLPLHAQSLIHELSSGDVWPAARLSTEAQRRAAVLRRFCGPADNSFVIAHANSASFFADLWAVWQAGATAVCVNPALTAPEWARVLDFVRPRAVLVADSGGPSLTSAVPLVCTAREPAPAGLAPHAPAQLDDPALVLFTSGTTGHPKGVVHSHRSLLARTGLNQQHIGAALSGRSLCVLPTHFGHGLIGNCLSPLRAGGQLFLMPAAGVGGAQQLGAVIDQHRIGFLSSVPAFWRLVLKLSKPPQADVLQRVHIGSAPLSAELWRAVVAWTGTDAVANMYGITETANWVGGALARDLSPEDGLLGQAWGGRLAVRGDDGQVLAHGQGEILVQTPSMMSGYLHRPDLTSAVLSDGWYRTGDIGTLDERGVLRMTGRERYMINRGGIKVYPEELDLLFERHPQVQEACAFAMPDGAGGEAVGLALRLHDGATVSTGELAAWARQQIRPEAVPSRITLLAEIPKTDRGKLNRSQVEQHCRAAHAGGGAP